MLELTFSSSLCMQNSVQKLMCCDDNNNIELFYYLEANFIS